MKVVIVGSGNVGTVLSQLIYKSGHEIMQVVSRNPDHARALASHYNASSAALTEPEFADADIYIVALNDTVLESIEKITALQNKFVAHTAGSVSIKVLKKITSTCSVLYPLQTLSKAAHEIPEIPFLVEADTKETLHKITEFARSLSGKVTTATEAERLHYHVAAVFAGSFTNHMYAIAEDFCILEKIDFKNLLPLIQEVNSRLINFSPKEVQTGPAVRDDIFTINRHLQTLSAHPDIKYLYLKLSESIIKLHGKH